MCGKLFDWDRQLSAVVPAVPAASAALSNLSNDLQNELSEIIIFYVPERDIMHFTDSP